MGTDAMTSGTGGAPGVTLRRLGATDMAAADAMARTAFGLAGDAFAAMPTERPGRRIWGAVDMSGRILAKATDREQQHWFGGRAVAAAGVAGVVVGPEHRGRGLGRLVLTGLLAAARDRGAVISTLFRTTPAVYRALGWEEVGALTWTSVPTAALAGLRVPPEVTMQAATEADVPAVLAAYREQARTGNGYLERSGPLFDLTPSAVLAAHDGLTVARRADGRLVGVASWDRGPGYDASGTLSVPDLITTEPAGLVALLAMLGSWRDVAPTLRLRLPPQDPATLLAPMTGTSVLRSEPWMLRVVDAAGAVAARGWPELVSGAVDLELEDAQCPWNAGRCRLLVADGWAAWSPAVQGRYASGRAASPCCGREGRPSPSCAGPGW